MNTLCTSLNVLRKLLPHSNSESKITSNLISGNKLAGITFVNTKSSSMDMNNIHGSQDGVFLDEQSL